MFKIDRSKINTGLEKAASLSIQLANSPEDWDQEILDNAYRMHPWLSDFALSVDFIKKLPDRRYGLGGITISAQQPLVPVTNQAPLGGPPQLPKQLALAHIPLIVREGTLSPLDLFVTNGEVFPLDENSFRKKMTGQLEAQSTSSSRSDPTLIGHLWPPGRSSFGGPGAEMGLSILNKFSSAYDEASTSQFFSTVEKLAEDTLKTFSEKEGFPLVTSVLAGDVRADRQKIACLSEVIGGSVGLNDSMGDIISNIVGALPADLPPRGAVVQIIRADDGSMMRTANPGAFDFSKFRPVDVEAAVSEDPTVFCSLAPSARVKTSKATSVSFDYPAVCAATLKDGQNERRGLLFSTVIDLDGEPTGKSLFSELDRKGWCLESNLYAEVASEVLDPGADPISGTGVFVLRGQNGVVCTVPITIMATEMTAKGLCYKCVVHGSRMTSGAMPIDTSVKMYITQGIVRPIYAANSNSLLIPSSYTWLHVGESKFKPFMPLQVDRGVVGVRKLASNSYLLEGKPVAQVVDGPLTAADTALVLAATGVDTKEIAGVMKQAEAGVTLVDCRMLKKAQAPAVQLPKTVDVELLKAAAALDDPNTVDSVLGLNIMDTETEDNFMILAQNLEETQQKLARLLLLSRLGLYTIPEGAAKICMARLNPIIDSLKILALQNAYGG